MKGAAPREKLVADLLHRIEVYRADRKSIPVLRVNKDLGGGIPREPLLVSRDDLVDINLGLDKSSKSIFVSLNKNVRNSLQ